MKRACIRIGYLLEIDIFHLDYYQRPVYEAMFRSYNVTKLVEVVICLVDVESHKGTCRPHAFEKRAGI